MRTASHHYVDPLSQVWTTAAARIGLVLRRSADVHASTDGRGHLVVDDGSGFDPDDCLAQMILHELCHSLVEGEDSFALADWGLDNTSQRDAVKEHAAIRVQATLAGRHGLRRVLAPTTDFRAFHDALGADALEPRTDPSSVLAIAALQRAGGAPWSPHLQEALEATAAIARAAARFDGARAPGTEPGPSLWELVDEAPAPHPSGLPPSAVPQRTCGGCAWRHRGGPGRPVDRCRQARDARVEPSWPGCERWEGVLDCRECAACCRGAYDSVTVSRRDPVVSRHPELVVDRGEYVELRREGALCAALVDESVEGEAPSWSCTVYDDRPRCCREFEIAGQHCLTARRRVHLSS